jgi:hypothetical protein
MKQAEVAAAATRETGQEYNLPLAVDGIPAPELEVADREYDRNIIHPHDQENHP